MTFTLECSGNTGARRGLGPRDPDPRKGIPMSSHIEELNPGLKDIGRY